MADDIIIKYRVDTTEFNKAEVAVQDVTNLIKEQNTEITKTYSNKSLDEAVAKLYEQGKVMDALVLKHGDANKALKAMQKELDTMAVLGQRGTEKFRELADQTAHLKDTIGDTRGEIKKMASDTRVFDTMVQGARGITAAFTVATGAAAVFGSENKDLEKAILKVQGAMAALQGVQELANIATEKGGIATKAYGVALQVVDKISKVTGLSMAASWALATGGITLVIGALTTLYYWYNKNKDEADQFEKDEIERQERLGKAIQDGYSKSLKAANEADKEFERQQDITRKNAILENKDENQIELELLIEKQKRISDILKTFNLNSVFLGEENAKERKKALEDMLLDTEVALKKLRKKIDTPQVSAVEPITPITKVEPLITTDVVDMNKRNAEQMNADLKQYLYDKAIADQKEMQNTIMNTMKAFSSAFAEVTNGIFSIQTENLRINADEQYAIISDLHDKEVKSAHGNKDKQKKADEKYAKEKAKIDKKLAIEEAKIKRDQAIANKATALFNIAINIAEAVSKYAGGLPGTAALMAIAIALGAAQVAIVAATPLPEIPKFEKGGAVVLGGGRMEDGHLFGRSHRQGGMLINAQGGEYIWDIPTVQKHGDIIQAAHENKIEDLMFHKYVVPTLENIAKAEANVYDDWRLRGEVKNMNVVSQKNAQYIVNGISSNIKEVVYFNNRYR